MASLAMSCCAGLPTAQNSAKTKNGRLILMFFTATGYAPSRKRYPTGVFLANPEQALGRRQPSARTLAYGVLHRESESFLAGGGVRIVESDNSMEEATR